MTRHLAILWLLFWLASCAGSDLGSGYGTVSPPGAAHASPAQSLPNAACPQASAGSPCDGTVGAGVAAPPSPGTAVPPSPSLPAPNLPAAMTQPSLPRLGSPLFGPTGLLGTVINRTGNTAVVAPVGGGAPGIYVPNGNGTATISQPGGVPVVVPVR